MQNKTNIDCPFCADTIARSVFAESKHFRAIYNIAPILEGHSLIIPKAHYQSVMELTPAELAELTLFGRYVTSLVLRAFKADAFDLTIQEGAAAGQTIPHLHMHIIPRKTGDLPEPGDWYPELKTQPTNAIDSGTRKKLTPSEMSAATETLRRIGEQVGPFPG